MHLRHLLVNASALLCLCAIRAADPVPMTHEQFRSEVKRINEEYKGDIVRLTEELNKLNRRAARETGREAELDARTRLRQKYAPVTAGTEVLPAEGRPGLMIDQSAWKILLEAKDHELTLSLYLDKARYAKAEPKNLKVQLRRKGRTVKDEEEMAKGANMADTFRIELPVHESSGKIYVVRAIIPKEERKQYVIDVSADIEPGWATLSSLPLD